MRSPWSIGAASLTWLLICGALASGAFDVIGLWILGTCLALLLNRRNHPNHPAAHAIADPRVTTSQEQQDLAQAAQVPAESIPKPGACAGPASPATVDELLSPQSVDADLESADPDSMNINDSSLVVADQGIVSAASWAAPESDSVPGLTILTAAQVARVLATDPMLVERAMAKGHLPGVS